MVLLRRNKVLGEYTKAFRGEKSRLEFLDPHKTGISLISENTLIAIENGNEKVRTKTVKLLFQAVGMDLDTFEQFYQQKLLQAQMDYETATEEIGQLIFDGHYSEAKERYDSELSKPETYERDNPLVKQQFMFYEAIFLSWLDKDGKQAIQKNVEALLLTQTKEILVEDTKGVGVTLNLTYISSQSFKRTEYQLLSSYASILSKLDMLEEAILLNEALVSSLKLPLVAKELRERMLTMVYFNLSDCLVDAGRYTEAVELCEEGIAYHRKIKSWRLMGYLYTNQADAFASLGEKEKAHHLFNLAINQFENDGEQENASVVKSFTLEKYQMTL